MPSVGVLCLHCLQLRETKACMHSSTKLYRLNSEAFFRYRLTPDLRTCKLLTHSQSISTFGFNCVLWLQIVGMLPFLETDFEVPTQRSLRTISSRYNLVALVMTLIRNLLPTWLLTWIIRGTSSEQRPCVAESLVWFSETDSQNR